MKLVFLIGSGAVGKMTVGQELMKLTGLRLFHNHMTIEPVIEIFGSYNGAAVAGMREVIFREFAKTDCYGMIFTYMWAFDQPSDWDYIEHVRQIFAPYVRSSIMWSWWRIRRCGWSATKRKTGSGTRPASATWRCPTGG